MIAAGSGRGALGADRLVAWAWPLLTACVSAPAAPAAVGAPSAPAVAASSAAPLSELRYRLALDPELSRLDVRLCANGPLPPELVSGVRGGAAALAEAWLDAPGAARPTLRVAGNALVLGRAAPEACVRYAIDLTRADTSFGLDAQRREGVVILNNALWLFRPRRYQHVKRLRVELDLPAGVQARLAWPAEGDALVADPTALAYYGHAIFGRFELERFTHGAAAVEVAIAPGFTPEARAAIVPWLQSAVAAVASVRGELPAARVLALVAPEGGRQRAVRFGMATRGGGAALLLLVPRDAELASLRADWVAIHELSHLLHPFVERADAWLSEGLATYYQEILRVRAGLLSEHATLERFHEGARRAEGSSANLAQASREMFRTFEFARVYWGGALFALACDVELRRRTGGKRTLDHVMAEIASCCAGAHSPWSADALLARMDRVAGSPLFSQLAERWVHGAAAPDPTALFGELGVRIDGGEVQLAAEGEGAALRKAILSAQP